MTKPGAKMPATTTVYFVSDHTGISAEMFGRMLLSQFHDISVARVTLPFIDSVEKACRARLEIESQAKRDGSTPVVFSTLTTPDLRAALVTEHALVLDLFGTYLGALEQTLGQSAKPATGLSHGMGDPSLYKRRIDAVQFALAHDDGSRSDTLTEADIVLVGVSRAGKTPTCLYLALQHGIKAANYPLTEEDFEPPSLPPVLRQLGKPLFGLVIDPRRLHAIREERRPGTRYASEENCRAETAAARAIMDEANIPYLDTTSKSVEEIAAAIIHHASFDHPGGISGFGHSSGTPRPWMPRR